MALEIRCLNYSEFVKIASNAHMVRKTLAKLLDDWALLLFRSQ